MNQGKGVSFFIDAPPVDDSHLSSPDATDQHVKAPSPVRQQPSLLLGSVSPELVKNLPAVFPPSPSPRRGQRELSSGFHTVSTPALQQVPVVTGSPQVTSISASVKGQLQTAVLTVSPPHKVAANPNVSHQGPLSTRAGSDDGTHAMTPSVLTLNDVNPPAVQRVVVEHVMRASEAVSPSHSSFRLRPFSGKTPRPNSELDYDTWRANVDLFLSDPSMSDLHRTRKILDSLLPPATDVIKHVSPQALPSVYLQLLDSVYGSVEDGDELLAKLMGTLQNGDEKASDYLNRLQVALSAAVRRGGVADSERNRYLLKQFCRGCWNDGLIADLQLERRTGAPPSFAELVLLVRTEEDKQASKLSRMKRHLGLNRQALAPKPRAAAQQLIACSCTTPERDITETEVLKKQLGEIQAQVAVMQTTSPRKAKHDRPEATEISTLKKQIVDIQAQVADMRKTTNRPKTNHAEETEAETLKRQLALLQAQVTPSQAQSHMTPSHAPPRDFYMTARHQSPYRKVSGQSTSGLTAPTRPRPWYCFRCGEDAHLAVNCVSEPNPLLVEEKRRLLKEKQWQWDQHNGSTEVHQLNC